MICAYNTAKIYLPTFLIMVGMYVFPDESVGRAVAMPSTYPTMIQSCIRQILKIVSFEINIFNLFGAHWVLRPEFFIS